MEIKEKNIQLLLLFQVPVLRVDNTIFLPLLQKEVFMIIGFLHHGGRDSKKQEKPEIVYQGKRSSNIKTDTG